MMTPASQSCSRSGSLQPSATGSLLGSSEVFKALQQNLKVKSFVGTSENALRIQIWTARIAILLTPMGAPSFESEVVAVQPGLDAPAKSLYLSRFGRMAR
jgi:hypothetical protein